MVLLHSHGCFQLQQLLAYSLQDFSLDTDSGRLSVGGGDFTADSLLKRSKRPFSS